MLENISYEVMPFKGTEEAVLACVPTTTRITVTASPARGLEATMSHTELLSREGYLVAPHLSARMIADEAQLRDVVARLSAAGVSTVFVVAGDGEPTGSFSDALALLRALEEIGHQFDDVGIAGYPEGHPAISDEDLWRALVDKSQYADHIVTQVCFNAGTTLAWAHEATRRGVDLPIRIGMPGAVSRQKLMRISARIGLGDSARFLKKQQSMFWRFFLPGGYSPNKLIKGLSPHFGSEEPEIRGLHIFTFNDLEATEAWRQKMLTGLKE
jgi:methylenetetrahydrofolate reductase (NADPH)